MDAVAGNDGGRDYLYSLAKLSNTTIKYSKHQFILGIPDLNRF
jgi:hypothetical protein